MLCVTPAAAGTATKLLLYTINVNQGFQFLLCYYEQVSGYKVSKWFGTGTGTGTFFHVIHTRLARAAFGYRIGLCIDGRTITTCFRLVGVGTLCTSPESIV